MWLEGAGQVWRRACLFGGGDGGCVTGCPPPAGESRVFFFLYIFFWWGGACVTPCGARGRGRRRLKLGMVHDGTAPSGGGSTDDSSSPPAGLNGPGAAEGATPVAAGGSLSDSLGILVCCGVATPLARWWCVSAWGGGGLVYLLSVPDPNLVSAALCFLFISAVSPSFLFYITDGGTRRRGGPRTEASGPSSTPHRASSEAAGRKLWRVHFGWQRGSLLLRLGFGWDLKWVLRGEQIGPIHNKIKLRPFPGFGAKVLMSDVKTYL